MGDVVKFDFKQNRIDTELEELEEDVQMAEQHVDSLLVEFDDILTEYGFNERDEVFAKNYYYMMEALRSMVLGYYGMTHPFQEVAWRMIDTKYEPDTDSYYVTWREKALDTEDDI